MEILRWLNVSRVEKREEVYASDKGLSRFVKIYERLDLEIIYR